MKRWHAKSSRVSDSGAQAGQAQFGCGNGNRRIDGTKASEDKGSLLGYLLVAASQIAGSAKKRTNKPIISALNGARGVVSGKRKVIYPVSISKKTQALEMRAIRKFGHRT